MKKSILLFAALLITMTVAAQRTSKTAFNTCDVIIVGTPYQSDQNYPKKMEEAMIKGGFKVDDKKDSLFITSKPLKVLGGWQIMSLQAQTDDIIIRSQFKYDKAYYKSLRHPGTDFTYTQYQGVSRDTHKKVNTICFNKMEKMAKIIGVPGRKAYSY